MNKTPMLIVPATEDFAIPVITLASRRIQSARSDQMTKITS